ncbi:MAG: hypothetical protein AAFW64_03950 [Pseudomonadota bacterium]
MRWIIVGLFALALAGLALLAPLAMNAANTRALVQLADGDARGAVQTFETLARFGHRDAINNLGVIRMRGLDGNRDPDAAVALFERAEAKGHLVAGYNLARLAANKHDTPMAEVAVTLARLEPLVREGDPHAAALMARHLYFNNRSTLVNRIEERRLGLYEQAAASGDPIYIYLHARQLWDTAHPDDTEGMVRAVETMLRAAEAGEPRAMMHMGDMFRQSRSDDLEQFEGGYPGGDQFYWWNLAAEAGEMAATCRYGVNWFREISRLETPLPVFGSAPVAPDAATAQALSHLVTCANAGKRPRRGSPVFGVPALYLGRYMGGFERSSTAISYAQKTYGMLLLEGRLMDRDEDLGRDYLARAAQRNDFARAVLTALDADGAQ